MAKNQPELNVTATHDGHILTVNGKTYTLLRHYSSAGTGVFFIAVAGRVPLRGDDLAKHWRVTRANRRGTSVGQVYFAYQTRKFLKGGNINDRHTTTFNQCQTFQRHRTQVAE